MSNPRNRNLLIIIGVLLLTNIAVLVYFLGQKKSEKTAAVQHTSERERAGISEMLQKEVGFTDEQTAQYKILKDKQRQTIRPMYDDMRKAKDSLFRLLSYPETPDSLLSKASESIAEKQKALDLQTFYHFKRVRSLCTQEQLPKYDSMILRMFRKMGRPPRQTETDKSKAK